MKKTDEKIINKLQEECKKEGFYCPQKYVVFGEWAKTPTYMRLFFKLQEREEVLKKIDIYFERKKIYYNQPATELNKAIVFLLIDINNELVEQLKKEEK